MRTFMFFIFVWLVVSAKMYAQCSVTSWMTPTTLASDASFGTYAFTIPVNAAASDNAYAAAASTISLFSGNTEYLQSTGFNFSIPATATICGVEVQVERSAENIGLFTSVEDASVRLVKNNTVAGSNKAATTNWTGSDATATYGSDADGWAASLTPADINAPGFGVAVSAKISGLVSLLPVARIDQVRMRVYYMVTLALDQTDFNVSEKDGYAMITVMNAPVGQDSQLTLERSTDQRRWDAVQAFPATANVTWVDNDAVNGDYYYRLTCNHAGGGIAYSPVRYIRLVSGSGIHVINPVDRQINVWCSTGIKTIELFSTRGERLFSHHYKKPVQQFTTDAERLEPGMYVLKVNGYPRLLMRR